MGIPLVIALAAGLFFVFRSRARGPPHRPDHGKVEKINLSWAPIRAAEGSGQNEYELLIERDTPAELDAKPV